MVPVSFNEAYYALSRKTRKKLRQSILNEGLAKSEAVIKEWRRATRPSPVVVARLNEIFAELSFKEGKAFFDFPYIVVFQLELPKQKKVAHASS